MLCAASANVIGNFYFMQSSSKSLILPDLYCADMNSFWKDIFSTWIILAHLLQTTTEVFDL